MQQSQPKSQNRRRVSLSKRRDEIEKWVSEGRSDEWIAEALDTSRSSVQSFRSRNRIMRRSADADATALHQERSAPSAGTRSVFEGVLDQGEEDGYGLWLDPAVADDPTFREGFSGVSDVRVVIERGRIVLEPASDQSTGSAEPPDEHTVSDEPSHWLETISATGFEPEHAGAGASASGDAGGEPGRVKWFDVDRGYGFLIRPDGGELFFHHSEIENADSLQAGEFVFYEPGRNQRGPIATAVRAAG